MQRSPWILALGLMLTAGCEKSDTTAPEPAAAPAAPEAPEAPEEPEAPAEGADDGGEEAPEE